MPIEVNVFNLHFHFHFGEKKRIWSLWGRKDETATASTGGDQIADASTP
jgi:hypothetical protein